MTKYLKHYSYVLFMIFSIFGAFLLFFPDKSDAESYIQKLRYAKRRYTLYGSLELAYERWWYDPSAQTSSQFRQNYLLGLRGFVLDHRIMNFDISGSFSHSSGQNTPRYSLIGTNVFVRLLEDLPPRMLKTSWKYLPHPIALHYSHYSDLYDYTNYGVSLTHSIPGGIRIGGGENGNGKGNGNGGTFIPYPTTFFDYNRYEINSDGSKTVTDRYSIRSFITGKHYDYRFLYDYERSNDFKRQSFEFQPNYRFYNPEARRSLEIWNSLRLDKADSMDSFNARSTVTFSKFFNGNGLQLQGGVQYFTVSNAETTEGYSAFANGQYSMVVSPRLTTTPFVFLNVAENDSSHTHSERIGNTMVFDISRVFRNTTTVFFGNTQDGNEYGLDINFYTKTRIALSAGYGFSVLSNQDGRLTNHVFSASASGPILTNLSFSTNASYTINDVSETANPASEDIFRYSAVLYWQLPKTPVNLGADYLKTINKTSSSRSERSFLVLYTNISRPLTRRIFFSLYGAWARDSNSTSTTTILVSPRLGWRYGMTSVNLEYDLRRRSPSDQPAWTEHRFLVRLVRNFMRMF